MLRVKLDQERTGLIPYNETTESTLFKDNAIAYPLEFAKNKLLVTTISSNMYLLDNWYVVKCIFDPISANNYKTYAFPLPEFNEASFPFIAICGQYHISILNIDNLEHKPLTSGMNPVGLNVRFAFATSDLSGI